MRDIRWLVPRCTVVWCLRIRRPSRYCPAAAAAAAAWLGYADRHPECWRRRSPWRTSRSTPKRTGTASLRLAPDERTRRPVARSPRAEGAAPEVQECEGRRSWRRGQTAIGVGPLDFGLEIPVHFALCLQSAPQQQETSMRSPHSSRTGREKETSSAWNPVALATSPVISTRETAGSTARVRVLRNASWSAPIGTRLQSREW